MRRGAPEPPGATACERTERPVRGLLVAVAAAGLLACSASTEPRTGLEGVRPAPTALASSAEPAPPAPTAAPAAAHVDRVVFDASTVSPLLDDPRLAEARSALAAHRPLDAAKAVERAAPPIEAGGAAFYYLAGRLARLGGNPARAAADFDRAARADGPLAPFALLAAGELFEAAGDHASAARCASAIPAGTVPAPRLRVLSAKSLLRTGEERAAVAQLREIVASRQRGFVKIALELSRALLAHPSPSSALEAARTALSVSLDAPSGRGADEADKILREARATLSADVREAFDAALSPTERAKRLVASGQHKRALAILDRLAKKGSLDCDGLAIRAEALGGVKRHSEASVEYGRALEACERDGAGDLATLLYAAGRSAARGGRLDLAKERYARLEALFPRHRLADDARLEGARAALADGDEATFVRMLSHIDEDYPEGDLRADALFALGIGLASKGDWAAAAPAFARGAALPAERGYERAGRFSYFLGRALVETGHVDEGRAKLVETIRDAPCGLTMVEAFTRLEALERGAGRRALDEARGHATAPSNEVERAVVESPAWRAAVALVEVDDADAALAALEPLGVSLRTASPDTLWAAARLLARTSDPRAAQSILRSAFEVEPRPGRNEAWELRRSYPVGDALLGWQLAYPRPFPEEVARASSEAGVPAALIYAVMREESAFDPDAVSKAGAIGLLQLMPGTAAKLARPLRLDASEAKLHDPETNLRLGARYLSQLRAAFADDPLLAIPGYNAGKGAPEAWTRDDPGEDFDLFVERIPYAETRAYTKRVVASLCAYELTWGSVDASEALRAPLHVRAAP